MRTIEKLVLPCGLAAGLLSAQPLHANIIFTAENAGVQASHGSRHNHGNIDELTPGGLGTYVSPIGTFSGGEVVGANEYGGAGGTGNYYAVGVESGTASATLTFKSAQDYVGLWWSAGDANNVLKFYNGTTLLDSFNVGSIIPSLTSAYYGNPNSAFLGQDANEPFEYLDFTALGGEQITSVEFDNNLSTGFELDNLSLSDTVTNPPGHSVPDAASSCLLLLIGVAALFGFGPSQLWGCRRENLNSGCMQE